MATVGYGSMSPANFYGHCVATVEIITGMLSMAIITSLVFARFSKPTARILFSRVAVIAPYDGVPTLMLRVANQRQSYILEAAASLVLLRDDETSDGHSLRRFYDLKLERSRSPMFALSWQIMHRIDETSPLHGVTLQAIKDGDMRLAVTISGVDETFAAGITARHTYAHEDILFERRFVDIFSEGDHPRHLYVDLSRFHEHEPVPTPVEKPATR
jgi:inward rectifier potassium channel